MAFDREDFLSFTKVAYILKEDSHDDQIRQLRNYIAFLFDYDAATIASTSVADLASALEGAALAE